MFSPVEPGVRFPEIEQEVLQLWRDGDVFQKSLALREGAPEFIFYEGPPTANGKPGVHHVQARAYKDLFPRYKTMRGFQVQRKAGWDCHGLPVELEVEKRLGFSGKKSIEEYGVEAFNRQCRASVMEYEQAWREMTERIGFWIDLDDAYMTMSNGYVESVWWSLKQLWDKNLVYLGYKVIPYCPRCGTPLSSHEVGLGYEDIVDPSITIRFPLVDPQALGLPENTSLLVWTTTPWTLPGNTAAAVHPTLSYVAARKDGEVFILAQALADRVLGEGSYEILQTLTADQLREVRYTPPYPSVGQQVELRNPLGEPAGPAWRVVQGDFVTSGDGTGIVHMAPAFGADDMDMARRHNLPVLRTVTEEGRFTPEVPLVAGEFFKKGDPVIIKELKERGVLFHRADYKHSYPHCWRCTTPLMYYATNSWFIRNTSVKDELIAKNQDIQWHPPHIKNGRYGDWLDNLVDWALSRSRYWGTPLPIWTCEACEAQEMVGSFDELAKRSGTPLQADFDPHRPYVDRITFKCKCGGEMRRVADVIDCWYDSGSMPFAQFHYPFENLARFEKAFPADFICEGLDQTRGWFNSLHQLGVMVFDRIAYQTVICHGLVLDKNGDKMSKTRGNVVNPWDVLNTHGADALRWYLYISAPPEANRRFSVELVGDAVRSYMLTLWNTYAFFVTYANLDQPDLKNKVPLEQRPLIDRWAIARVLETVTQVTEALEAYDPTRGARALEQFVDDLSNWYVRRNRRRFWKSESDADKRAAYQTLHECLATLAKLTAPFTPFMAEAMYQNLVRRVDATAPESVHLCDYPQAPAAPMEVELLQSTRAVIEVVSLGFAARASAKLKTRQPLAEAVVHARNAQEIAWLKAFEDQLLEELNVKKVRFLGADDHFVSYKLLPNLKDGSFGKKYGRLIPAIKAALEQGDVHTIATAVRAEQAVTLTLADGSAVELQPNEILVNAQAAQGYAFAEEGGRLAAVDTRLDDALILEGIARDLVRNIQDARKKAGYQVSDRIEAFLAAAGEVRRAAEAHRDTIEAETLSRLHFGPSPSDAEYNESVEIAGEQVAVALRRVGVPA